MRWWRLILPISKIPTTRRDVWLWAGAKVFWWIGGPTLLAGLVVILVAVPLLDFMVGDFGGAGTGEVSNGQIKLNSMTQARDQALQRVYDEVASSWQSGLTKSQIHDVQTEQVDMPGVVLLAVQKMQDNFANPDPQRLYSFLQPTYHWRTYLLTTKTYQNMRVRQVVKDSRGQSHRRTVVECKVTTAITPTTVLITASTWDGTLTNTFRVVTSGETACPPNGIRVYRQQIQLHSSSRHYSWSRIWNLFAHLPVKQAGHSVNIQKGKAMRDMLAGLIAAQDPSVNDPYVQSMVDVLLSTGAPVAFPFDVHVASAGGNTVQNVLRWKPYIDAYAVKYQVPTVLVAAVMAQESGGREHDASGQVLSSGVGSNGLGALGLMQMEPSTASGMDVNGQYIGQNAVADLSNGPLNIEIGTKYLSELYHQFGLSQREAESAYNAGPSAEEAALAQGEPVAQNPQTLDYVTQMEDTWIPLLTPYFATAVHPAITLRVN